MEKLVDLILDNYDGSLKAEHGTGINMAPYVRAGVGREGDRADVAGQGARRPRRRARSGRGPQPRPRRPPPQPEDHAGDRGGRHHLRRVRLLRAGLPEPPPDHHAAAADRDPPRDGPPARRLAGAAGAARAVRVRRHPDLRRRRDLPDRLPPRDRHGQARQGVPRAGAHPARPAQRGAGGRSASSGSRALARAGLRTGIAAGPLDASRLDGVAGAARRDELVPDLAAQHAAARAGRAAQRPHARAPPPSTCRPASTGSSGRINGSRLAARPRTRRPAPARGAGRRLGPRRPACVDPRRRRRPLLLGALDLEGLLRGRRADGQPDRRGAVALERGGRAADRDRRELLRARPGERGRRQPDARRTAERHGKLEILDSVAWAKRLLPKLSIGEKLGSVAVHPTCSTRHLGLERELREIAGEMASEVVQPIRATCCGMAGDRGLLHPELTAVGHRGGGRRARRLGATTPTCAATAPARSGSSREPAPPTSPS